ncbi:hypothetical protein C8F04DRAFT_1127600 [Mycena alexandri]|uniref:F-box domain-containing protein n=1 Tax=Mycena alexandri TaxID=1745969 RepID=A0AAD6SE88_9AGAR|nr:hypothetical protein C8F04DRAFT_1127600 [Mycena alexandri]
MAHHTLSSASRATCPQELVDLILGETDRDNLKSCALVARSFRPTSQKLIFSDLTILPSGRDSILALQRLADVLSASPHLALHVRTLHLVQPRFNEPCVWMQSDILSVILSVFTGLESLNIRLFNWDYLHSSCEQAIYALITRSSLSSIELQETRLQTSARLLALLRCFPASLESVSFLTVFAAHDWSDRDDQKIASIELHQLRLASLHLNSHSPALLHWAIRAVDPKCLRHLHTIVVPHTLHDVQELLDSAVYVETYNLSFQSVFSHLESPNLEKMQGLRTLEISVTLNWGEIEEVGEQGQHNPLNDAMRTLDTAPHTVEHLVLNLNIWNPDELFRFMGSASLEHLGEGLPALRDVVVRLRSRYDDLALQRGIRYLTAVFHRLQYQGMLTAIVVRPPRRGIN